MLEFLKSILETAARISPRRSATLVTWSSDLGVGGVGLGGAAAREEEIPKMPAGRRIASAFKVPRRTAMRPLLTPMSKSKPSRIDGQTLILTPRQKNSCGRGAKMREWPAASGDTPELIGTNRVPGGVLAVNTVHAGHGVAFDLAAEGEHVASLGAEFDVRDRK